jgi:CRISPR-associated protein Csb2
MIAISLSFPAGRYHATPWGRHVNEGAVEWPPSPWRLLRSLVAVWKRTLPDVPEADIKPIFEALADTPPRFVLPAASTGHTRHYMPWYKKGPTDRTLVFDAFVAIDPGQSGAVHAIWPDATVTREQRALLERLLANLNFLGRAESWCEACLINDDQAEGVLENGDLIHAAPLDSDAAPASRRDLELVRTLCADPASAFKTEHVTDEREETVEVEVTTKRGVKIKKGKRRVPVSVYDPNWHLCMETLRLHDQKWSDPPGSRWVTYTRPRNCFDILSASAVSRRPRQRAPIAARPIHIARFALDSSVLPLVTDTLPVAEAARRALMSIFGRLTEVNGVRGRSPILAGKDAFGTPLSGHRHAYFLPTDEDADGRLDHLTVYAAEGFGPNELRALERLHLINRHSPHPLRVLLLATSSADLATLKARSPRSPLARSNVWVSATPYVVTRHPKTRGPHKLEFADAAARDRYIRDDLIAQLRAQRPDFANGASDDVRVHPMTDGHARFLVSTQAGSSHALRPLQFKRSRSKRTDDGGRRLAGAYSLSFSQPISGPLALGHSSHFGMGLFLPDDHRG